MNITDAARQALTDEQLERLHNDAEIAAADPGGGS